MSYDPRVVERKWQQRWQAAQSFRAVPGREREKYYCIEMLPYPSGRIHVGHIRNYSIGDANCWFKRLAGYNVLHAIGWDAMGLPAENAAIKNGVPPAEWTYANIEHMRETLQRLGFSYDWSREVATCHPGYYKWNQWFFLKLLEQDLAYRARRTLNWCPRCETVLANEQVTADGCCWRHEETRVESVELDQWFVRTTRFAQELLDGIEELEAGWPERVLSMQRNWIGRSEGCRFGFQVEGLAQSIEVFSTRVDTIYGCSAVVLAAAHPLALQLAAGTSQSAAVERFVSEQRDAKPDPVGVETEKTGVFTGRWAINPFSNQRVPIWLANFVLMEFGTGAVFCQPAHDQRDFEFATKYGLAIQPVILDQDGQALDPTQLQQAWTEDGILTGSGPYDGLSSSEARRRMASDTARHGFGGPSIQFRLRDWGISRQRYWGTPIPIIYCDSCGVVPVPEDQLPVELPDVPDWKGATGSPLAQIDSFVRVDCPRCGSPARRETDTMDTFVDSSWYFLRYLDPRNESQPFEREIADYWMPIDQYIGGVEHAVGHLIYFRFWTRFLARCGLLAVNEPARALFTQGMVCGRSYRCATHDYIAPEHVTGTADDARCPDCQSKLVVKVDKVSKSKLNAPDSDALLERYGADAVRMFSLFGGPPVKDLEWSEQGIEGCARFLQRVARAIERWGSAAGSADLAQLDASDQIALPLRRRTHRTIERVTRDLGREFQHNTAIAALMELVNEIYRFAEGKDSAQLSPGSRAALHEAFDVLIRLMAPFAPHLAEEMNEALGHVEGLTQRRWPDLDPDLLIEDQVEIPVQILGKVRGTVTVPRGANQAAVFDHVQRDPALSRHLAGKELVRTIFVADRLINLVTRG